MKRFLFSWAPIILGALLVVPAGRSLAPGEYEGGPETLDEYDFVARGKMSPDRGTNPTEIARMDNNGELLIACLEPRTTEQLESSGIRFVRSQLELLTDWNLLRYDRTSKAYSTTIYVYGPQKASAIRSLIQASALKLARSLDTNLTALRSRLEKYERVKSLFSVLYAYVLHGYTMDRLVEEISQKPQLSAEHPFWNGYSWAIYPIRKFNIGPLHLAAEGTHFYALGGESVPGPGFRQWLTFIKDVAVDHRIDDPELVKTFSAFEIANEEGQLTIPIFEDSWAAQLENMARTAYEETSELAALTEMQEILKMTTRAQAEMFIHYELRYAFLDLLIKNGNVTAPVDFENVAKNRSADVGNLIFLIKPGNSGK